MEPIVFHCARPVLNSDGEIVTTTNAKGVKKAVKKPYTHTLAFTVINGIIVVGWAKKHAHDSYNKKAGRALAVERASNIAQFINDYPEAEIADACYQAVYDEEGDIVEDERNIPSDILCSKSNFDYYLSKVVTLIKDELDMDEEDYTIVLNSSDEDLGVVAISLDGGIVRASLVEVEKVEAEVPSDFIFCTFYDEEDELVFAVQNRESFYADGLDMKVNDAMIDALDPVMSNIPGVEALSEDGVTFLSTELEELKLIRELKAAGLGYDPNLETEFVSDAEDE